jgi:hypothetical protein
MSLQVAWEKRVGDVVDATPVDLGIRAEHAFPRDRPTPNERRAQPRGWRVLSAPGKQPVADASSADAAQIQENGRTMETEERYLGDGVVRLGQRCGNVSTNEAKLGGASGYPERLRRRYPKAASTTTTMMTIQSQVDM